MVSNLAIITLRAAGKAAFRNPTGSVREYCSCKTTGDSPRCGCYKVQRPCTAHCHPGGVGSSYYSILKRLKRVRILK